MNILMLSATYPPSVNGVSESVYRLICALRKHGHKVGIIGPALFNKGMLKTQTSQYVGLPVLHIPGLTPKDYPIPIPILRRDVKLFIEHTAWDIIHVHHPGPLTFFAKRLGKIYGIPVVVSVHTQYNTYIDMYAGLIPKPVRTHIYSRFVLESYTHTNGVIASTHFLKKELSALLTVPVYYATSAMLSEIFEQATEQLIPKSSKVIPLLIVSRLVREKSVDIAIRAFSRTLKYMPFLTLMVVGDGKDRNRLQSLAQYLKCDSRITFAGQMSQKKIQEYYQRSRVFLFPSTTDVAPLVLREALSNGCTVVAAESNAAHEVIVNRKNGILTRNNSTSFAQGIIRAMRLPYHRTYTTCVRSVRPYFRNEVVRQFETIYRDVIGRKKRT